MSDRTETRDRLTSTAAVTVTLGEPILVAQAPPEVRGWGPYQFPRIERLGDGSLHVTYHVEADSATAYGLPSGHAVSRDEGQTWHAVDSPPVDGGLELPNGDRLLADPDRSLMVEDLALPAPAASVHAFCGVVDMDYYHTRDLPPELVRAWPFLRRRAGETEWQREWATVDVGEEADVRCVSEGVFHAPFFEQSRLRVAPDGSLRTTTYFLPHLGPRDKVIRVFLVRVLRSADSGRTWQQISTIPYRPDFAADPLWDLRDGFNENLVHDLSDGSLFCLLRTHDGCVGPLYWARSEDGGLTWSDPQVFDDRGVWPQLLTLDCGVTLASYGRPGLFVRASADPAGLGWDDRVTVVPPDDPGNDPSVAFGHDTCSYSGLVPLDADRALLVYSHFAYLNAEGRPCKTILCRTVSVAV